MTIMTTARERLLDLHDETCRGCKSTMLKKNADYSGGSGDPYSNFKISDAFGIHPAMGIVLRITDKLQRIRAFAKNGVLAVESESVEDACDDIVNYAILIKGMLREERLQNQKAGNQPVK
jgi:Nucleotide modification associated domain 1